MRHVYSNDVYSVWEYAFYVHGYPLCRAKKRSFRLVSLFLTSDSRPRTFSDALGFGGHCWAISVMRYLPRRRLHAAQSSAAASSCISMRLNFAIGKSFGQDREGRGSIVQQRREETTGETLFARRSHSTGPLVDHFLPPCELGKTL